MTKKQHTGKPLLGPGGVGYPAWRSARTNRIAKPRRCKAAQQLNERARKDKERD